MRVSKWIQFVLCFGLAAGICVAARTLDTEARAARMQADSYRWARQIATQAEGLMLSARLDKQKDPLAWAVNFLAQGEEPRVMRISRSQFPDLQGLERSRFDPRSGMFEFVRILDSDSQAGVQIKIENRPVGFLGVPSLFTSDLLTLLLFGMTFLSAVALSARLPYFGRDDAALKVAEAFRERVLIWVGDARQVLVTLGTRVRNLIREAQKLAESSALSRDLVHQIREKTHSGIRGANHARKELDELDYLCRLIEVLALNLRIQMERGSASREASVTGEELHIAIKKLKAQTRLSRERVIAIERELEPISADADQAVEAFEAVAASVEALDGCINQTKESLLRQARDIQGFTREMSEINEPASLKRAR